MKKKKINKLALKKTAISKLDHLKGGLEQAQPFSPGPATNMISNCHVCDSIRRTQCKGNDCPNFSVPCNDDVVAEPAQPIGA